MKTLNRLKKIVHSLLYISRIENDQFAKNDTVNVRRLVEEVMDELSHRLEINEIKFSNNTSAKVNVKQVNHDLVFQLLYNLINNAIRYNKLNGSISINEQYVHGGPYIILIKDTGIGIRQEELGTIFNRFKKSGNTDSEGLGLGLSIVKSIALYHGYTVSVNSELDKGTTFSITIPAEMVNS